jgi:hypothetical protein
MEENSMTSLGEGRGANLDVMMLERYLEGCEKGGLKGEGIREKR